MDAMAMTVTEAMAEVIDDEGVVNGPEDVVVGWDATRWHKAEENVRRLRQRIFAASHVGDLKKVRNLQKLMLRSRSNALIAVRRVTDINAGRKTAGIDGKLLTKPSKDALRRIRKDCPPRCEGYAGITPTR